VTIPLTFDWLTVAWLKTRLSLWLRGRVSPRKLALLFLLGVFSGCVPATRFEETQSAAQVEMEGRRRSEQRAQELQAENAQLRAQMQQSAQALDEREQALSQAQLDSTTLGKQRQDAEGMVEQLRGELQRVGGHMQAFNDDKHKLEAALGDEAARGRELSSLSRDLALSLPEPLATGEYSLDAEQRAIVLRLPRAKMLNDDGSVKPEAEPVLKAVARVLALHKTSKLRVEDSAAPGDALAVQKLVAALTERAVGAERFEPLLPEPGPTEKTDEPELALGFSVP
jgi:flagellar motor protein MotB